MSGKSQTVWDFTVSRPAQILPIYRIVARGLSLSFPIMNFVGLEKARQKSKLEHKCNSIPVTWMHTSLCCVVLNTSVFLHSSMQGFPFWKNRSHLNEKNKEVLGQRIFKKKREIWSVPHTVFQVAPVRQRVLFRYIRSPERFEHLLTLVAPYIEKKACRTRDPISLAERLVMTLRYLATGDSQQSQSFNFRIGKSTICHIIQETCIGIWNALSDVYLKCPSSSSDWEGIANEMFEEWNFPHCIGALDGKHVMIECPPNGGSQYLTTKDIIVLFYWQCVTPNTALLW